MPVLFALLDHPPVPGGMSRYYAELLRRLPPDEVVVLTLHDPPPVATPYPVVAVPLPRRGALSLSRYPRWWQAFGETLRQHRPCGLLLGHLGLGKVRGPARSLPYGLFVHGLDVLHEQKKTNPWKRRRLHALFAGARLVITNSQATQRLLHRLGLPVTTSVVIHPGVDPKVFRPLKTPTKDLRALWGLPPSGFLVLFLGRPVPRKGLGLLLEVLPHLPEDVHLVAAGPGDFSAYQRQAQELGVAHRTWFLGPVPEDHLVHLYNATDLLAMPVVPQPHDMEGFGIVFLEANACERPVVGSQSGGVPEAVVHGETGWLIPPGDRQALHRALLNLYTHPHLRARLGKAGRQRVLQSFTWDLQAQRLRAAYRQYLCPKGLSLEPQGREN